MNWVKFKAQTQLNKKCSAVKCSKIKGVPKLDDANDAGKLTLKWVGGWLGGNNNNEKTLRRRLLNVRRHPL